MSNHVKVRWIDTPGLFPGDIRARHMAVELPPALPSGSDDQVVWRSSFECNGSCQRIITNEESDGYEGPANDLKRFAEQRRREINSAAKPNDEYLPRVPHKPTHSCKVRLMLRPRTRSVHADGDQIEMTVAQVQRQACTITYLEQSFHPAALPNVLKVSPHVRSMLHDAASCTGMTQSRLKICEWLSVTALHTEIGIGYNERKSYNSYPAWLALEYPAQTPSDGDFRAAIKTVLTQTKLDGDPLSAVAVICRRRPSEVIA